MSTETQQVGFVRRRVGRGADIRTNDLCSGKYFTFPTFQTSLKAKMDIIKSIIRIGIAGRVVRCISGILVNVLFYVLKRLPGFTIGRAVRTVLWLFALCAGIARILSETSQDVRTTPSVTPIMSNDSCTVMCYDLFLRQSEGQCTLQDEADENNHQAWTFGNEQDLLKALSSDLGLIPAPDLYTPLKDFISQSESIIFSRTQISDDYERIRTRSSVRTLSEANTAQSHDIDQDTYQLEIVDDVVAKLRSTFFVCQNLVLLWQSLTAELETELVYTKTVLNYQKDRRERGLERWQHWFYKQLHPGFPSSLDDRSTLSALDRIREGRKKIGIVRKMFDKTGICFVKEVTRLLADWDDTRGSHLPARTILENVVDASKHWNKLPVASALVKRDRNTGEPSSV